DYYCMVWHNNGVLF
nr:immunoglobulin light chain junction region [Macaca mulatta]MOV95649.1 immunoglobulin light chain junction region [Macaca mulatta]MOV96073.1 immunoglobulin light chain junction region [Macaca mulatta]MOV96679.1 immunoglobulin light chain junction region [Macaca mulatta]MOV96681.1 immunoglobulin light chain junction region [Macaca mulatta]